MGDKTRTRKEDEILSLKIREDQKLTAKWYMKMSGQLPWKDGEKDWFSYRFEALNVEIRELWAKDNVEWFAGLPDS